MARDPLVAPAPRELPLPSAPTPTPATTQTTPDGRQLILHPDGELLAFAPEVRCTANRTDGSGRRCKNPSHPGANVCNFHGARAPQVRRAASRRVERERLHENISKLLAELEDDLADQNPIFALIDAQRRAQAMVVVLSSLLVDAAPLSDRGQLVIDLYERWLTLQARTAKLCLDARLDERYVSLAEHHGMTLFRILTTAFNDPVVALTDRQKVDLEVALRDALAAEEAHHGIVGTNPGTRP